ncbi:Asparaginase [Candidatus Bealeia paramacronuclearis]|uniref:Asparaginase n=1 Tax=Candidatus Bealeia paramacronuclearis TaxID=1921001 RepID=A0ABZ2C627_9PROT|nr:Asparaginase [Candidatus Bealeia paramacronuclearis]
MENPILVISSRVHYPESQHRGAIAVVNAAGKVVYSVGDIETPIFPRSASKLFQVLPLIESGAVDAYHLGQEEIALACGSHNGEDTHVQIGEKWLQKINKNENILACGTHRPMGKKAVQELIKKHQSPTPLHNACSGKHLGFITTALHRGEDPQEYISRQHPTQKRVEHTLSEITNFETSTAPHAIDGCEIPVIAIPLYNLAWGMANLADPKSLPYVRQKAIHLVIDSLKNHPNLIAGDGAFDTELIRATEGRIIAKMGASGTYVAFSSEHALGIALKIDDGNIKAAEIAMIHILEELGLIDTERSETLGHEKIIFTYNSKPVGKIHAAPKKRQF